MKTQHIIFILFIVISSCLSAQEKPIQLKLEEGKEYVFEMIDNDYGIVSDNSKNYYQIRDKVVRLVVGKFVEGQEAIISASFLKNTYDRPSNENLISKIDLFYPDFTQVTYLQKSNDLLDMYLCRTQIKFSMDLSSRKIKILNRAELLEGFYSFLRLQGLGEKELKNTIEHTNKELLNEQEYLVSHLLWFQNATIGADSTVNNSLIGDKLSVVTKGNKFLAFSDMAVKDLIPGKTYKKYWTETDNGIVTNYNSIRKDSVISTSYDFMTDDKLEWRISETNLSFLYSKHVPDNKLVISGKIEAPLSNIIHIKTLEDPCGIRMNERTFLLDEQGSFNADIDFLNGGFVYVENENLNKHLPPKIFVFYATPGDTLGFVYKGKEQPDDLSFYGTRINESELIKDIRDNIKLYSDTEKISKRSNVIFDNEYNIFLYSFNNKIYGKEELTISLNELKKIEKLTSKYESLIDKHALHFIKNETQSYVYSGLFQFFANDYAMRISGFIHNKDGNIISTFSNKSRYPDLTALENQLDQVNVQKIYNDYGVYSRMMISSYYNYQFRKANKIDIGYSASFGFTYQRDPENRIQFMRLILSGSSLYREIASILEDILIKDSRAYYYPSNNEENWTNVALNIINLMNKRCNDLSLVSYMNRLTQQHQKLEDDNYLPAITFLNFDGKEVSFKDLTNGKPTVFNIAEGWGHDRYHFDDLAQENKDLNFVLVCENTNFANWKDYTNRAEPIAEQLLFVNDSISIRDVFQKPYVYIVLDKQGKMAGYARDADDGIKKARDTLNPPKKQLDKSQLQFIILILTITLALLIIGLIIWRWRARQRLRKEEQKRRLRELELTAIRSQMNPHFLFNSLNSVQNLIQQNKGREAHLYLADFAGLIRKVLNNSEKEEVSLAEELEMVNQYLNLEKLRFDFDFTIVVSDDIDSNNTMVPSMLMQPFVENAVIHGLQNKNGDRQMKIEVFREQTSIKLIIEDNGVGREAAKEISKARNGKGSKLMKERLEILQQKQGEKYTLQTIDLEEGTRVEIVLPDEC